MLGDIIIPALLLGGMGLLFGLGLGFASVKFRVDADPRLTLIRDALPGANCGGCGYAGCGAFAEAALKGEVKPSGCPVGGKKSADKICAVLGADFETPEHKRAFVRCGGCHGNREILYNYTGLQDCTAIVQLPGGGPKSCAYGCLGAGGCKAVCKFGAISVSDGAAAVNPDKCTACGLCVKACPKKLITMVPYENRVLVNCHSKDAGRNVRKNCRVGCIGCKLCEKACKYDAVHVRNNLAAIDYKRCVQCGACALKCPSKCIITY